MQDQWAWCSKCQSIFYGPHQPQSVCPKGGPHVIGTGSYNYQLSYSGVYPVPPSPPPPPSPSTNGVNPIPKVVAGCYWTNWNSFTLGQVNSAYNLIWLFAGTCSSTGTVTWGAPSSESAAQFKTDLQAKRAAGVCCILTVGGASRSVPLTNATNASNFVSSILAINAALGGIDGLDFDIEDTGDIDPTELVWVAQQLKAAIPGFNITWAGASPWYITNGPAAAKAMVAANALDLVGVMCYDWGQSSEAAKISMTEQYVTAWVNAVGASRVCIGIELPNVDDSASNTFGSYTSAVTVWNWATAAYPGVRGMDIWTAWEDARPSGGSGGAFVAKVIPVVLG